MKQNRIEKIVKKLESGFLGFWIKQYKVSFLLIFLMIILGVFSFVSIEKRSSPDLDLGIISINKAYIGVNPEDIDSLITDKIEKKIKNISGIKKITSVSSLGFSNITVELENGVPIQETLTKMKDKVDTISFPDNVEDTFIEDISTKDNKLFSIIMYADENKYSKDYVIEKALQFRDSLEGSDGMNEIEVQGTDEYEVRILINKAKLDKLGLSIRQLSTIVAEHNRNTPIGNYSIGDLDYDYRFDGEITSLKELLDIPIQSEGSSIVYLKDIAEVKKHFLNDSFSRVGINDNTGYVGIIVDILKSDKEDFASSAEISKQKIEETLKGHNYKGIEYKVFHDTSEQMKKDYEELFSNLATTFTLVFLTLLLFIGFKEGFIGILIVPLSYLITFIVLYYLGFSLNFMTNFSLIISLGVAIDTIIVVIEGANKKVQLGYAPKHAILVAIREYAAPIISGTMTTLAAFIPLLTLPGTIGKYLSYIPITVFITLLASLFLSLTVTSAIFMVLTKNRTHYRENLKEEKTISKDELLLLESDREGKELKHGTKSHIREQIFDDIARKYYNILKKTLSSTKIRLFLIFVPILALLVSFSFGNGFTLFPESDNRNISITLEAQDGRNKESMVEFLPLISTQLEGIKELETYFINLDGNKIKASLELLSKQERKELGLRDSFKVEEEINNKMEIFRTKGLKVESGVQAGGPPGGKAVGVKLIADGTEYLQELTKVSSDFEEYLKSLNGTKNVGTSSNKTPGQFVFKLNYDKIAQLGLTPSQITSTIFESTKGLKAGTIKGRLDDYDLKIQIAEFEHNLSPYDLENLVLTTPVGKVKLTDVATYKFETAISNINRIDTDIVISVESDVVAGEVASNFQPKLMEYAKNYDYPIGITYKAAGETEENSDLIISTLTAFVIALFLIFMILVLQFNSYAQPLIILYSVVLALLGVNIGLQIMGLPYSMAFAIGFIALTGIVINNAIIYIDKINTNTREGLDSFDAILQAGKSRLVPMLVTTVTTVFGMLPIAFQDQFWAGLGFTVVFGLVTGTLMTLFVIPALFYQVFRAKRGLLMLLLGLVITIISYILINIPLGYLV